MDRRFCLGQISRNAYMWAQVSADGEVALLPPTLASSPDLGPVARFTTRSPLVRDSQSRAGTKPPLQVKCLRRFTIWRGDFYRRAPRVKIFSRASRALRALHFYIVTFSFSRTLYQRQCPLGSTLPPYFFLFLPLSFFQKNLKKEICVNIDFY